MADIVSFSMLFIRAVLYLIIAYYSLALAYHWLIRKRGRSSPKQLRDKTVMVVFGSGGHTTEMLHMLDGLQVEKYGQVCFVLGHSDTWSQTKMKASLPEATMKRVQIVSLFRAREVKQSYWTSIITFLIGLVHSIKLVARIRPDLIVSNGPGTAVPLCYASFFIQRCMLINPSAKLLFIESFCRVKSLSLTAKLLKPIADK